MFSKRIFQHVVEAILQIQDIGICVELPDLLTDQQPPLMLCIRDLVHPGLACNHLVPDQFLCFHLMNRYINTAPIDIMLFRSIKDSLHFHHMLCKNAWQELQAAVCRQIPQRELILYLVHPGFQPLLICLRQLLIPGNQRFQRSYCQLEMIFQFSIDNGLRDHIVLVIKVFFHELIRCLHVIQDLAFDRQRRNDVAKSLETHRYIAYCCRRLAGAFSRKHPRTLKALLPNHSTGHRTGTRFQEMIDLLLRVRRIVVLIRL